MEPFWWAAQCVAWGVPAGWYWVCAEPVGSLWGMRIGCCLDVAWWPLVACDCDSMWDLWLIFKTFPITQDLCLISMCDVRRSRRMAWFCGFGVLTTVAAARLVSTSVGSVSIDTITSGIICSILKWIGGLSISGMMAALGQKKFDRQGLVVSLVGKSCPNRSMMLN